jgi:hypothetical protein
MDTLAWLSSALARFSTPDPALRPTDFDDVLHRAFTTAWNGQELVNELIPEVLKSSSGEVTLRFGDPTLFGTQLRGPAAYLVLTGSRRVVLTPDPHSPLRFDDR